MLTTGIKGTLERTVTEELTAKAMGSGELPVFATPAVVALAEECAWKSVAGELEEGHIGEARMITRMFASFGNNDLAALKQFLDFPAALAE